MECRKELSGVKRREQIIDNLREHGEVTVKILSNQFGVSEMTIRRDLHLLEEQGYATIHYGGATLLDRQNIGCQSFSLRKGKESENKRRIAKKTFADWRLSKHYNKLSGATVLPTAAFSDATPFH